MLILSDQLRAGTEAMLQALRALGIDRIVLATGDRHEVAEAVAGGLAIDLVRAELTPDQKILVVLGERKYGPVMMIGDGVNDAPALAAADIGLAMGAKGRRGLGGSRRRGAAGRSTRPRASGHKDRAALALHRLAERDRRHGALIPGDDRRGLRSFRPSKARCCRK